LRCSDRTKKVEQQSLKESGMGRLNGKVAVITGATSGIGLRTAEIFVAEGAKIVVAGRRAKEGDALASKLGAACIFRRTDVTIEDEMRALIGEAVERFGRIDCLFNNAGGPAQTGGIEDLQVAGSTPRWRPWCAA